MFIRQISVFLENKKGRLTDITKLLGDNGIDLIAMSIADTANFGILRVITTDTDKAIQLIINNGFTANVAEVLAVLVPDAPGGLANILNLLSENDVSVEYLYSFVRTHNKNAMVMFRVDNNQKAYQILTANGIKLVSEQDITERQ